MKQRSLPVLAGAGALMLSLLACRPVFAIGWSELLILFLLTAFLLGPILFRLARSWNEFQSSRKKKKE